MGLPTVIGRGDDDDDEEEEKTPEASMGLPTVIGRGDPAAIPDPHKPG